MAEPKDKLGRVLSVIALLIALCALGLDGYKYYQDRREFINIRTSRLFAKMYFDDDQLSAFLEDGFTSMDAGDYDFRIEAEVNIYNLSGNPVIIANDRVSDNDAIGLQWYMWNKPLRGASVPGHGMAATKLNYRLPDSAVTYPDTKYDIDKHIRKYVVEHFRRAVIDEVITVDPAAENYGSGVAQLFWEAIRSFYKENSLPCELEYEIETAADNTFGHTVDLDASFGYYDLQLKE